MLLTAFFSSPIELKTIGVLTSNEEGDVARSTAGSLGACTLGYCAIACCSVVTARDGRVIGDMSGARRCCIGVLLGLLF